MNSQPLRQARGVEMGIDPDFIRLVRLAGRALYCDLPIGSAGRTGAVLDALTDSGHQWVREDDLVDAVKIRKKEMNPILQFLIEEKLIQREVPEKSKGGKKIIPAATNSTKERKHKAHVSSYCCLDYSKVYDVVRCRVLGMTEKAKSELDRKEAVQQYFCTRCRRSYSALDALQLASSKDEFFHCERCDCKLVVEDGEDNEIKYKKALELLHKLENELEPLTSLLQKLKGVPSPEFITLQEWSNGVTKESVDAVTATPISLPESINVESSLDENGIHENRLKALPPWMIKGVGLNLTENERKVLDFKLSIDHQVGMMSEPGDCV